MTPKIINYQEALNFNEICEEAYGNDPEPIYVVLEKTDGNKYEKFIGVLLPLELYKMMF